jgi:hypothetical protein
MIQRVQSSVALQASHADDVQYQHSRFTAARPSVVNCNVDELSSPLPWFYFFLGDTQSHAIQVHDSRCVVH